MPRSKAFSDKPFPEACRGSGRYNFAIYMAEHLGWLRVETRCVAWCKLCFGRVANPTDHYRSVHTLDADKPEIFCDRCKKPVTLKTKEPISSKYNQPFIQAHLEGRSHTLNKDPVKVAALKLCPVCYRQECGHRGNPIFKPVLRDVSAHELDFLPQTAGLSNAPYLELLKAVPSQKKVCFAVNSNFAYMNGPCLDHLTSVPELNETALELSRIHSSTVEPFVRVQDDGRWIGSVMETFQFSSCAICDLEGQKKKLGMNLVVFTGGVKFDKRDAVADAMSVVEKVEYKDERPTTLTKAAWLLLSEEEQDMYSLTKGIATLLT